MLINFLFKIKVYKYAIYIALIFNPSITVACDNFLIAQNSPWPIVSGIKIQFPNENKFIWTDVDVPVNLFQIMPESNPLQPQISNAYWLFLMSNLSYAFNHSDAGTLLGQLKWKDTQEKVVNEIEIIEDDKLKTRVLIIHTTKNEVMIAFEGSVYLENWISNIQFYLKKSKRFVNGKEFTQRIHWGFYETVQSLLPRIIDSLSKKAQGKRVWITGHSFGCCQRSDFFHHNPNKAWVVRFQNPC
jgi:hypothetical protein